MEISLLFFSYGISMELSRIEEYQKIYHARATGSREALRQQNLTEFSLTLSDGEIGYKGIYQNIFPNPICHHLETVRKRKTRFKNMSHTNFVGIRLTGSCALNN